MSSCSGPDCTHPSHANNTDLVQRILSEAPQPPDGRRIVTKAWARRRGWRPAKPAGRITMDLVMTAPVDQLEAIQAQKPHDAGRFTRAIEKRNRKERERTARLRAQPTREDT